MFKFIVRSDYLEGERILEFSIFNFGFSKVIGKVGPISENYSHKLTGIDLSKEGLGIYLGRTFGNGMDRDKGWGFYNRWKVIFMGDIKRMDKEVISTLRETHYVETDHGVVELNYNIKEVKLTKHYERFGSDSKISLVISREEDLYNPDDDTLDNELKDFWVRDGNYKQIIDNDLRFIKYWNLRICETETN